MLIIKNETQRLNLNDAHIWVAVPVIVLLAYPQCINMHNINKR